MGRIAMLVLSTILSGLLVTGLLGLTERFADSTHVSVDTKNRPVRGNTAVQTACELRLPAAIPGTSLIAEYMVCYEGPFIEDRSDAPVVDVAALVLRNAGDQLVTRADVTVERAGEQYHFSATYILPGMSVMVLEASGADYFRDGITTLSGAEKTEPYLPAVFRALELQHKDLACITVTNLSDREMKNLILYHKTYLPDGTLVGGITYKTEIEALPPDGTVTIYPEHYAKDYSQIFYAQ